MFDKDRFREFVTEVLKKYSEILGLPLYSESAVNLILGTCAQESSFGKYRHQINGPAHGIMQIEERTFEWLKSVWAPRGAPDVSFEDLICNDEASIIYARLLYWPKPRALPAPDDVFGLGCYWKDYYNTRLGKGTVQQFVRNYRRFVG